MTKGSMVVLYPIASVINDITIDNLIVSSSTKEGFDRHFKSTNKERTRYRNTSKNEISSIISNGQTLYRARQQRFRKVSFADKLTLKIIKRIPKIYTKDIWYTANDMDKFRTRVLNSEELRLKVRLKSARCRNHMRRVLLEYRISRGHKEKKVTTQHVTTRNCLNLSNFSQRSSEKQKEAAMENATNLEKEIMVDQSFLNPTISSACFGRSHRWVFDYYLGSLIDTLCTII